MLNKISLLSLGALVVFAGCQAETKIKIDTKLAISVENQFLKGTNSILSGAFGIKELTFKIDGELGSEECYIMTANQFEAYKNIIEYFVNGYSIVSDESDPEVQYITFSGKVDFERGIHFCGIRKLSVFEKFKKFLKDRDYKMLLKTIWVYVEDDSYTHIALKTDIENNSEIVNKTSEDGFLIGFSCVKKCGDLVDFEFGKL